MAAQWTKLPHMISRRMAACDPRTRYHVLQGSQSMGANYRKKLKSMLARGGRSTWMVGLNPLYLPYSALCLPHESTGAEPSFIRAKIRFALVHEVLLCHNG